MLNTLGMNTPVVPRAKRSCVFCHRQVDGWLPYRLRVWDYSPFVTRVDVIGSNVERFWCPHCSSTDRERHLYLFLDRLDLCSSLKGSSILHMAPEGHLGALIQSFSPASYIKGDLFPTDTSMAQVDLENIAFPDGTFNMVIANHMLEHVSSPIVALREVHRVLKSGGRLICQTPFASRLTTTFEEPHLQTDSDRLFFYGQEDHVRLFGSDIQRLLLEQGFVGRLVPHEQILLDIDPELAGVNEREPFFDFVRS